MCLVTNNYRKPILRCQGPESGELESLYGIYRISSSGVGGLRSAPLVQLNL